MAYMGQKIISNFLTKPGFHMVNINRYIFGHELGPAVCYHEFNTFQELCKVLLLAFKWSFCLFVGFFYFFCNCARGLYYSGFALMSCDFWGML